MSGGDRFTVRGRRHDSGYDRIFFLLFFTLSRLNCELYLNVSEGKLRMQCKLFTYTERSPNVFGGFSVVLMHYLGCFFPCQKDQTIEVLCLWGQRACGLQNQWVDLPGAAWSTVLQRGRWLPICSVAWENMGNSHPKGLSPCQLEDKRFLQQREKAGV